MFIARHADNRTGRCSKSLTEIASAFAISHDTVSRYLLTLEKFGLVAREERDRGRTSVFVVLQVQKRAGRLQAGDSATKPRLDSQSVASASPPALGRTPTASPHTPTASGNKDRRLFQDSLKTKPTPSLAKVDPRFTPIKEFVKRCCEHAGVPFVWDASEAANLNRWLKAAPDHPLESCLELVRERFRSAREPGERPRKWIGDLGRFTGGRAAHGHTKRTRIQDSLESIRRSAGITLTDLGSKG